MSRVPRACGVLTQTLTHIQSVRDPSGSNPGEDGGKERRYPVPVTPQSKCIEVVSRTHRGFATCSHTPDPSALRSIRAVSKSPLTLQNRGGR